jgi:hypothetical protein
MYLRPDHQEQNIHPVTLGPSIKSLIRCKIVLSVINSNGWASSKEGQQGSLMQGEEPKTLGLINYSQ